MNRPTGYYIIRWGRRLRGQVIQLSEHCEQATLAAPHGWHRVPRWLYMALRPLMDMELKTLRSF